jgi:hypothetical protein
MARLKIDCCKPDCPKRSGECHGTCEKYKKQRAELDATNAEKAKEREAQSSLNGFKAENIHRYKKRINNRNRYGGGG